MISPEEGLSLARTFLSQEPMDPGIEVVVTSTRYIPEKNVLVVRYDSVQHQRSNAPDDVLLGAVPLKVDLATGALEYLSWAEADDLLSKAARCKMPRHGALNRAQAVCATVGDSPAGFCSEGDR